LVVPVHFITIIQQPADNSLVLGMESLQSKDTETTAVPSLRRNHSNLTLVSLSSESSDSSDSTTSSQSTDEASGRRRTRNKRKKQKKADPLDFVAKAVAGMTISEQEKSRYVALDCEMVGAGYKGKHSILARVTMVDWDHNVILDEFVKPQRPVTDYRTFVSGITPEILDQANTNLLDIEGS
jgi:DNA polymerase III epsilon subunit-like protein